MTPIERFLLWITVLMFWAIMLAPDEIIVRTAERMYENVRGQ